MEPRDLLPRLAGRLLPGVMSFGDSDAVYLTFDDGPDPAFTPRILDILERHASRGTFFVTGKVASTHPELTREILSRGHVVGSHDYLHRSLAGISRRGAEMELSRAVERLEEIIQREVRLFRPPFGRFNSVVLTMARRLDLTIVLWSLSLADWKSPEPAQLAQRFVRRARPGDIVLLHDSGHGTENLLTALPEMLHHLSGKGWRTGKVVSPLDQTGTE